MEAMFYKEYFLLKDNSNKDWSFRAFAEKNEVGMKIQESFLRKIGKNDYFLNDNNNKIGLFNYCYVIGGLMNLLLSFDLYENVETRNNLKKELATIKEKIKVSASNILNEIKKDGEYHFWPTPYVEDNICEEIMKKDVLYHYTGAMTWTLSVFVMVLNLASEEVRQTDVGIDLSEEESREYINVVRYILKFFTENVCECKEKGIIGWGFTNNTDKSLTPSLYFTYSVLESFNDFEDYVLGNEEKGINANITALRQINKEEVDPDDTESFNRTLVGQFRTLVRESGISIWKWVEEDDKINTLYFEDTFNTLTLLEVEKATRSAALFNTVYIILALMYSSVNLVLKEKSRSINATEEDVKAYEKIVREMRRAAQNVQVVYENFIRDGVENIVDRHVLFFGQSDKNKDRVEIAKTLNEEAIQASALIPTLLRAHSYIAFYVTKFPSKEMSDLVLEVEKISLKENGQAIWLWEGRKYDLFLTIRYIESIADFYSYYERYEKDFVGFLTDRNTMEEEERQKTRVDEQLKFHEKHSNEINELVKKHELVVEKVIRETEERVRKENAFEQAIKEVLIREFRYQLDEEMHNLTKKIVEEICKGDYLSEIFMTWFRNLENVQQVVNEKVLEESNYYQGDVNLAITDYIEDKLFGEIFSFIKAKK